MSLCTNWSRTKQELEPRSSQTLDQDWQQNSLPSHGSLSSLLLSHCYMKCQPLPAVPAVEALFGQQAKKGICGASYCQPPPTPKRAPIAARPRLLPDAIPKDMAGRTCV